MWYGRRFRNGRKEFPIVKDTASDITTPRLYNVSVLLYFSFDLVLTVRFRSLAPWGKLFQLFI